MKGRVPYRDLKRALDNKFPGDPSATKENQYRTPPSLPRVLVTLPKQHAGDNTVGWGTARSIRDQLHLNDDQFLKFHDCTMKRDEYTRLIVAALPARPVPPPKN